MFKEFLSLSTDNKSKSDDQSASTMTSQSSESSHPFRIILPTSTPIYISWWTSQKKSAKWRWYDWCRSWFTPSWWWNSYWSRRCLCHCVKKKTHTHTHTNTNTSRFLKSILAAANQVVKENLSWTYNGLQPKTVLQERSTKYLGNLTSYSKSMKRL